MKKKLEPALVPPIETDEWRGEKKPSMMVFIAFCVGVGMTVYEVATMQDMTILVCGTLLMCASAISSVF